MPDLAREDVPTKVTLEITPDGWTWRVWSDDVLLGEREFVLTGDGLGRANYYDPFIQMLEDTELAEALDDSSAGDCVMGHIATALNDLHKG